MKKLLALILCLCLSLGAVAFATELNKDVLEGQTTVKLTIDPEDNEFVVVIPATVTIDPETKIGSSEIVLKAGWKLVSSNGLRVKLIGAKNGITKTVDGYARFWLTDEDANKVQYSVGTVIGTATASLKYSEDGCSILTIGRSADSTVDKSTALKFSLDKLPTDPGEYTDVLTFAVQLY